MRHIPWAPRISVYCKVCGLTLAHKKSANKAKKVAEQHDRTTGHGDALQFAKHEPEQKP